MNNQHNTQIINSIQTTPDSAVNDPICIYFTGEPYVDAIITREELAAAHKRQYADLSLISRKRSSRGGLYKARGRVPRNPSKEVQ